MVPSIDTTNPSVQSQRPMFTDEKTEVAPKSADSTSTKRAPYEPPRVERRVPLHRHTLQGSQTSGSESVFPP